ETPALIHALVAVENETTDLFRSLRASLRELTDLGGHDGKPTALLAGARRFHRGIERQEVRLKRDAIDHADNVCDPVRAVADVLHRVDDSTDHVPASRCDLPRAAAQL